ncbi:carbohydrate-binding module family 18 protein [Poronia punctata]|nr:carbohydrate-binding module family 18 protein [Poronia punctata]
MIFRRSLAWAIALSSTTVQCLAKQSFRSTVYIDQYHPNISFTIDYTGITHAIMAFADPLAFMDEKNFPTPPLMNVSDVRKVFENGTKIGVALGGWGPLSTNFGYVSTKENRTIFAKNLASWVNKNGYDFVDIDWEYPGGNGAETPINGTREIEDLPLFLCSIRDALGKKNSTGDNGISLAVAGTEAGMLAFQNSIQTKPVWDSIDFITVMAYDLVNRVSNATGHHSDVKGSKLAVQRYLDLGLAPEKINLGYTFYAKWFQTAGPCNGTQLPIGCPIMKAQTDNGTDTYASGVLTFEPRYLNKTYPIDTQSLQVSPDGTCGYKDSNILTNYKCGEPYCCSDYGFCGDTKDHCIPNCQAGYGRCDGPDVVASFQRAQHGFTTDVENGALWYLDTAVTPHMFWTWENNIIMTRKYDDIVNNMTLGGVSGWSLGEDSFNWEHVGIMGQMAMMRQSSQPVQAQDPDDENACGNEA